MSQPTTMAFRPRTLDELIFNCVYLYNEYSLPEAFGPEDTIVDIGAHIGSFCYAALLRGAQHVYAFEADPSNCACAVRNLQSFGDRVRLENKAVWRSDKTVESLKICQSHQVENTGGGNVLWSERGIAVAAIAFDEIIQRVTQKGRKRVRMLKIDCETSEFPILLTSRKLHLIDSIVGEFHECGGPFDSNPIPDHARISGIARFTIEELTRVLRRAGFDVSHSRLKDSNQNDTNMGPFFAHRATRQSFLPMLRRLLNPRRVG